MQPVTTLTTGRNIQDAMLGSLNKITNRRADYKIVK